MLDRKDFLERKQKPGEKVDQYFAAFQVIYNSCAYDDHALTPEELRNQCLQDQLIVGLQDKMTQQKVSEHEMDTLMLEETLRTCRTQEVSRDTQGQLEAETAYIDEVNKSGGRNKSAYKQSKFTEATDGSAKGSPGDKCDRCGSSDHRKSASCPAFKVKCHSCNKTGHFKRVCRSKEEGSIGSVLVASLQKTDSCKRAQISTTIGKKTVQLKWTLDTAAEVNVISGEDLKKFSKVSVGSDCRCLRAADGSNWGG